MVWRQLGQTSTYQKKHIEPQLAVEVVSGKARLTLTGNTNTNYEILASDDLIQWQPIATRSIWDQPFDEELKLSNTQRFYQAREVE